MTELRLMMMQRVDVLDMMTATASRHLHSSLQLLQEVEVPVVMTCDLQSMPFFEKRRMMMTRANEKTKVNRPHHLCVK